VLLFVAYYLAGGIAALLGHTISIAELLAHAVAIGSAARIALVTCRAWLAATMSRCSYEYALLPCLWRRSNQRQRAMKAQCLFMASMAALVMAVMMASFIAVVVLMTAIVAMY